MKTLIAYFSLDGNTKWIAEQLHQKLPNTTIHTIELEKKPIKGKLWRMMFYGFKTTFYRKMSIKASHLNLAEYDTIIIGSPIWVGQVPPPMKAFLKQYPLASKKVAAFCSMGGEPSHFFDHLKRLSGIDEFEATLAMVEPLQHLTEDNYEKIDAFVEKIHEVYQFDTQKI